jgi:hypothetical protein
MEIMSAAAGQRLFDTARLVNSHYRSLPDESPANHPRPMCSLLTILGGLAAHAGGAKVMTGAIRVTFWGALAMAITAGVGWLFGTVA